MPTMSSWIRKYLLSVKAEKILDVGGRKGAMGDWLSIFPKAKYTVLNISEEDLPPKTENIETVVGDAQKMAFEGNKFDLAVSNQVLEHLEKPELCLREVIRVLKPGGYALFTTPNLAAWYNRLGLLFGYQPFNYTPSPEYRNIGFPKFVKKNNIYDHPRVFTHKALKELFEKIGYRVENMDVVNHTYEGQPYRKARELAHYLVPKGWKENIVILARKP